MNRFLNIYFVALPNPIGINKNITLHFVYDERRTPYLATPTINEQVDELLLRVGGLEGQVHLGAAAARREPLIARATDALRRPPSRALILLFGYSWMSRTKAVRSASESD